MRFRTIIAVAAVPAATAGLLLTIKLTGQSGGLYSYTATVYDAGSFTAIPGAHTPNQGGSYAGKVIAGHDSGWVGGTARYSFTATSLPTAGPNAGLPAYVNGDQGSTSTWYELAFPAGTTFGGTGIGTWGWTYRDSHGQRWTDTSANGDGRLSGDGNIA